ncbi:PREDICTED: uncharacterized protein LOC109169377 [Ipomoea nil]|uniref:uncharacterized protein LOC109169377 n=1 Tax=Ipomoea nil TaxID=35883 RepID=UPI000901EF8D|nr:PREDICTED: uncharacterized protein LOC109169377 [Ipomoea nil]
MGSVEVLRPQDALQKQFDYRDSGFVNSVMNSKRNFSSYPNPNPNPKPGRGFGKLDRRKRSPQKKGNSSGSGNGNGGVSFSSSPPETRGDFMVGQVRILKRGEGLGETAPLKKIGEKVEPKGCVERVESKTTPKKFNIADFYAGSACDSSPPPSSLPVPGFFKKKTILVENNDYATCDLRRLLRLDLS